MNLVFGSEVALLGFWEYMFGILVTVHISGMHNHTTNNFPFCIPQKDLAKLCREGFLFLPCTN